MAEKISFKAESVDHLVDKLDISFSVAKKNQASIDIDVRDLGLEFVSVYFPYEDIMDMNLEELIDYFVEGCPLPDEFVTALYESLDNLDNSLTSGKNKKPKS